MRMQALSLGMTPPVTHTSKRDIDDCLADFERQMKEGK